MAHTDFSTLDSIGQWEDEVTGFTLVADLDHPASRLAEALGALDSIALDTLDYARGLVESGEESLDSINDNSEYLWLLDLSARYAPADLVEAAVTRDRAERGIIGW